MTDAHSRAIGASDANEQRILGDPIILCDNFAGTK